MQKKVNKKRLLRQYFCFSRSKNTIVAAVGLIPLKFYNFCQASFFSTVTRRKRNRNSAAKKKPAG